MIVLVLMECLEMPNRPSIRTLVGGFANMRVKKRVLLLSSY